MLLAFRLASLRARSHRSWWCRSVVARGATGSVALARFARALDAPDSDRIEARLAIARAMQSYGESDAAREQVSLAFAESRIGEASPITLEHLMQAGDLIYVSVRPRCERGNGPETGETRMALVSLPAFFVIRTVNALFFVRAAGAE